MVRRHISHSVYIALTQFLELIGMGVSMSTVAPMAPEKHWLSIEHDGQRWEIDADFLTSSWTCIWDRGCHGIEADANAAGGLGCCSVGAELLDDEEAMTIAALAATIEPANFEHHGEFVKGGAFADELTPRGKANTRVVDGACIFLNRPGFAAGHGCALHAEAKRCDESPIDWKPSICWQLPLKVDHGENGKRLRGWLRSDWGTDGADMAWCCTEAKDVREAFVGDRPVIDSLRDELDALLGTDLVALVADAIEAAEE